MTTTNKRLRSRQFYALTWKDVIVRRRHFFWSLFELTIPVLVCGFAILTNLHTGKPKLEPERSFDPDDYEAIFGSLNPARHRLLIAPNTSFTRALLEHVDETNVKFELVDSEAELIDLIKAEIPVSLDQVKRLIPDDTSNVTVGGVFIEGLDNFSDESDEFEFEFDETFNDESELDLNSESSENIARTTRKISTNLPISQQHHQSSSNSNKQQDKHKSNLSTSRSPSTKTRHFNVIPLNLKLTIRVKDFRLQESAFPKKSSLGPFLHADHYVNTFFMAAQVMMSRAYISLVAQAAAATSDLSKLKSNINNNPTFTTTSKQQHFSRLIHEALHNKQSLPTSVNLPTADDIIGQRMPYPRYVAHKRLSETTLGKFVPGAQKQRPFAFTLDFCVAIGFLVTAIFLAKRLVDERKCRVRDMMKLVGVPDSIYFGSHLFNTLILMLIQCALITFIFTGHSEAPGSNISSSLLYANLVVYSLASLNYVILISSMFSSSTRAIICTALIWFGTPEILDRVFKLESGVIESSGYWAVDEIVYLALSVLSPNFGLRLANRLLTEADIYGEFYNKKKIYAEYRAIWANFNSVLPLYHSITFATILITFTASALIYMLLIVLQCQLAAASTGSDASGLVSLNVGGGAPSGSSSSGVTLLLKLVVNFFVTLVVAPFKLVAKLFSLLLGTSSSDNFNNKRTASRLSTPNSNNCSNNSSLSASTSEIQLHVTKQNNSSRLEAAVYSNNAFSNTSESISGEPSSTKPINVELNNFDTQQHQTTKHQNNVNNNNEQPSNRYFEDVPMVLQTGLSIRNVCKTYITNSKTLRTIEAVKNVSLDLYYSQILVLLGHNGAGKTTLIDIISGHNSKTSGKIFINGYDIDTNPSEARQQVGFCPQIDVLFERLTVAEHLYFYGIIKGASSFELKAETKQLLEQSGLVQHKNKLSKNLSGGYKRKLSLAIAMIAQSKLLILDEPTSGMDPESRRKVWDFLQLIKNDRLILMTTHHMEEADALGDRIAIMAAGKVRCCGSALFLKRAFDAGYRLRICKSIETWNQEAFDELIVSKHKLAPKLENETPHELAYKFTACETSSLLPQLFDDLEFKKDAIGIFGFGITVATMDDVFMLMSAKFKDLEASAAEQEQREQLALNNYHHNQHQHQNNNHKAKQQNKPKVSPLQVSEYLGHQEVLEMQKLQGSDLFKQHLKALLAKRYQHTRKNWLQLLWILFVSLSCIVGIVILLDFNIFKEELTPAWSLEMTLPDAGYGSNTRPVFQIAPEPVTEPPTTASESTASNSIIAEPTTSPVPTSLASGPTPAPSSSDIVSTTAKPTTVTLETDKPTTTTSQASSSSSQDQLESVTTTQTSPTTTTTTANPTLSSTEPSSERRRRGFVSSKKRLTRQVLDAAAGLSEESSASIEQEFSSREGISLDTPTHQNNNSMLSVESSAFLADFWLNEARKTGARGQVLLYKDINNDMIDLLTREFANFRENYIIGGERVSSKFIAWYNGEATHSFPIAMNTMLNSVLRMITQSTLEASNSATNSSINSNSLGTSISKPNTKPKPKHPLASSKISVKHVKMEQINTKIAFLPHLGRLINLVFLPFSLAFFTSYFVIFPTHERVTKSKHLQLMTGVSTRTFWLAHFLFDFILYSLYSCLMLFIYFVWDRILNDRKIYFANFEHSRASILTLVSLFELKYEIHATAKTQLVFSVFISIFRFIPSVSLLLGLQKLFSLNTTRAICINISPEVLDLLCKYINSPLVDEELQTLRPQRCCRAVCKDECFDQWPFFWTGWFGINVELMMLVIDACLLWFALVLIESKSIRNKLKNLLHLVTCGLLFKTSSNSSSNNTINNSKDELIRGELVSGNGYMYNYYYSQQPASKKAQSILGFVSRKSSYSWSVPQFLGNGTFDEFCTEKDKNNSNNTTTTTITTNNNINNNNNNNCKKEMKLEQAKVNKIIANNRMQDCAMLVSNLRKIYKHAPAKVEINNSAEQDVYGNDNFDKLDSFGDKRNKKQITMSKQKVPAVDGLSFCVDKREFFGLLGVNGAGKSTTFKMLTGEIESSSGNAFIGQTDVSSQRSEYLKKIGYCPQQDALIDQMSGKEMLTLFARLRGLPEPLVEIAVEQTLRNLGLKRISTVCCNKYSGGNKRRLSVGMALVGCPELVFLDEPTSGVDPSSRRKLWKTLIDYQNVTKSSIVMTSHSMNECESLCDRVAIMVAGQFKVLGSIQYLRTKLSMGFSLVLKVKPMTLNKLTDLSYSSQQFSDYLKVALEITDKQLTLRELHQTVISYHIAPTAHLSWSRMLKCLEKAKLELDLEDYQITSDASLESIFLSLARQQQQQHFSSSSS